MLKINLKQHTRLKQLYRYIYPDKLTKKIWNLARRTDCIVHKVWKVESHAKF